MARMLFSRAHTAREMADLFTEEVDEKIHTSSFHDRKAAQIREMADRVEAKFGGELPCDSEELRSFAGVGSKCANLVLGIACDQPRVSVDVHMHRVTNRWVYVDTRSPEQTSRVLETKLPKRDWVEINRLLVALGKQICSRCRPRSSICPALMMCQLVGVTDYS
jgi:endonuclease-3